MYGHEFAASVAGMILSLVAPLAQTGSAGSVALPSCTLTASPTTIDAGTPAQLSWRTESTTSGTIAEVGDISSAQLARGTATVYPRQNTLYTMAVSNAAGATRTCGALITLRQPTQYATYTYQQPAYSYPTVSYTTYSYPSPVVSSPAYVYSYDTWTPEPLYTSGWYPQPTYTYYEDEYDDIYIDEYYYDTYSPSYERGLGEYSLPSVWTDFGSGEYFTEDPDPYPSYTEPRWYEYYPDGWNGGSDPYDSGVWRGGSVDGSTDGWNGSVDSGSSGVWYGGTVGEAWDGWI